jgi:hypothetical protein
MKIILILQEKIYKIIKIVSFLILEFGMKIEKSAIHEKQLMIFI